MATAHAELMDRFIAALEAADVEGARACYDPDATIWHNFDGLEQTVEENLATLGWLHQTVDNVRYADIRREPLEGGVLQQHVLEGIVNGRPVSVPSCVVVRIVGGRITRLEEYLDPAPILRAGA
jgi:ketosteroid isomerase-like protein